MKISFFGKHPGAADFEQHHVSPEAVRLWHQWIRETLKALRNGNQSIWPSVYLQSPPWFFSVIEKKLGKDQRWLGVLMPSMDSVGRYFPMVLSFSVDRRWPALLALVAHLEHLKALEQVAIDLLNTPASSFADKLIEHPFVDLGMPSLAQAKQRCYGSQKLKHDGVYLDLDDQELHLNLSSGLVLEAAIEKTAPLNNSLWLSRVTGIEPCLLNVAGLPAAGDFALLQSQYEYESLADEAEVV